MTKLFPDEFGRYDRGVHLPCIRALGNTSTVRVVVVDRYSKEDADSMGSQVERHLALYPNDLDAREYRRMIEDGMFAKGTSTDPRIGAVSPADMHDLASFRKRDVVFAQLIPARIWSTTHRFGCLSRFRCLRTIRRAWCSPSRLLTRVCGRSGRRAPV